MCGSNSAREVLSNAGRSDGGITYDDREAGSTGRVVLRQHVRSDREVFVVTKFRACRSNA